MSFKKTSRKRESVFKAHVLDKLYPSEKPQEDESTQELSTKVSKVTPPRLADVKIYTVQLPPEGLPEAQTQASSSGNSDERLGSSDSEEEEHLPQKRKRKHRRKSSKVGYSSENVSSSAPPLILDDLPAQTHTRSPPQTTDTASLTKNQRRKLRKKRAKLGRHQDHPPRRATEFTCDEVHGPGLREADCDESPEENAEEVKEFMEAVWRVFTSDGCMAETVISQTQTFQNMMEQLASNQLPLEMVHRLKEIKKLLVLQDFTRARTKLLELGGRQSSTWGSDNISLFSTMAEYWMTDIAAPD